MISGAAIAAARARIAGDVLPTPLVPLPREAGAREVWLKLELAQPVGSFKLRGAANAVRSADPAELARGLVTVSAGNLAQAVAWMARSLGVPATAIVPDHASAAKLAGVERLGGRVLRVPESSLWQAVEERGLPGVEGCFVDPLGDEVVVGNATIAAEVLERLPAVEALLVPVGSGALAVGTAGAARALAPGTHVYGCEPETAPALTAALAAGRPTPVAVTPSFVEGAGARTILPPLWERLRDGVAGAVAVSLTETSAAIELMANRVGVAAEGAGAVATAAALSGRVPGRGPLVCVVSGGEVYPVLRRGSVPLS